MWSAGEVCSADADGDCYMLTSGGVIIKRRNYDETGTKTRSERGNLAKKRRCQFGNLIRYQFGPQQVMRSGGGMEGTLWGKPMTGAGTPHYTAHVTWTRRRAARVTACRDVSRCGAWICGAELFATGAGG